MGNVNKDFGRVNKEVKKYGRVFRNGVFYVICEKLNQLIKNCCFVVSLLAALSFLKKDILKWRETLIKGVMNYTVQMKFETFIKNAEYCGGGGVKTEDLDCLFEFSRATRC